MSTAKISTDHLSPDEKKRLKEMTRAPTIAWPTVIMWAVLSLGIIGSDILAVLGHIPLWAGMLINATIGYLAFSVGHDSIHRAVSSNAKFNDFVGQSGLMLIVPYVDIRLFRWAHILHHRFANGPRDPDIVLHGAWWTLPFRWMLIDVFYFIHAVKHGDKVSQPGFRGSLRRFAVVLVIFAVLIQAGYGMEILMLWFIPSRLVLLSLGLVFFWLPHVPHDTLQEENFTQATTVRIGMENLLGPALQYQNYHLIHHLFPMTPFYNNYKVWQLLESELRTKDLAVQHGVAIQPVIYPGKSS